jgi:hypothetical protein
VSYQLYDADVEAILMHAICRFHQINRGNNLTEADKKQLKAFYPQNMIVPKAKKLLEQHFPEEFGQSASSSAGKRARHHQDRP